MRNMSIEALENIVAENEVYANIVEEASARGEFAGGYANGKAGEYYEARNELARRGVKVGD